MGERASAKSMRLGRYVVVKHLAQGGMADVLLARTDGIEGFERHVVIKRIRAEQARDAGYVGMFFDEARLAASLHHQNIVQVNDIGEQGGEFFFAMEYVHGEDVRKLLAQVSERGESVPIQHVLTIATAAAAGLHHAHEQRGPDRRPLGIVHRDVSPANIMIGYDGSVKVADFGIAKAEHRSTETRSGTLKGKVAYMSPEQCVGEPVDRRSDVFALGIVLYELVTARRLFKGDNDFLTMTSIVLGDIPPPSNYRPDLHPGLEAIILKALENKPKDRYMTADDLRLALDRFADSAAVRTSTTALADYIKAQFGQRPEPWLVEADEPEIEMTVDFDGSASGIVRPPREAIGRFPTAGGPTNAPIVRARTKAITASQEPADPVAIVPVVAAAHPSAPVRRQRWVVAASLVGGVAVIGLAIGLVSRRDPPRPEPAALAPAPPQRVMPAVTPEPPAPPRVVPAPDEPAPVVVAPPPPVKKQVRKYLPPPPKPTPPAPTKHWDPTALFPK